MGDGGVGEEATPPYVMRALYGSSPKVRLLAVVRNPTDRLESSFWLHQHYPKKYGKSAEGLHAYVLEQTAAFASCERAHGTRKCAFMFELIDRKYSDVFFHADQFIRGLYAPFVEDWKAAFPSQLLLLRAEDLLDRHAQTAARVLAFLGLREGHKAHSTPPASYAASHLKLLAGSGAVSMLPATRAALNGFYGALLPVAARRSSRSRRASPLSLPPPPPPAPCLAPSAARVTPARPRHAAPHNAKLASMMGDQAFLWSDSLPVVGPPRP